jgi:DNA-binding MarR family transcriptional regulator
LPDQTAISIAADQKRVNRNMRKISRLSSHEMYTHGVSGSQDTGGSWTLLTGHGHVLIEIAREPEARIRDISAVVGLTERTVQAIVSDLERAGYLTRTRAGRRSRYTVNHDSLFRHPAQEGHRVGPFLELMAKAGESARTRADLEGK